MRKAIHIGIIGDFDPQSRHHRATDESIAHAADALGLSPAVRWLPTPELEGAQAAGKLAPFDGLWCAPGSPYQSMQGALDGIRYARERGKPFIAT